MNIISNVWHDPHCILIFLTPNDLYGILFIIISVPICLPYLCLILLICLRLSLNTTQIDFKGCSIFHFWSHARICPSLISPIFFISMLNWIPFVIFDFYVHSQLSTIFFNKFPKSYFAIVTAIGIPICFCQFSRARHRNRQTIFSKSTIHGKVSVNRFWGLQVSDQLIGRLINKGIKG